MTLNSYHSLKPTVNVAHIEAFGRVESCTNDIVSWMHEDILKLNRDRTERIVFTSQHNAKFVENVPVTVGESSIKSSPSGKKHFGLHWTRNSTWRNKLMQSVDHNLHSYNYPRTGFCIYMHIY